MSSFVVGILVGMPLGIIALLALVGMSAHFNRYGTFLPGRDTENERCRSPARDGIVDVAHVGPVGKGTI